MNNVLLVGIPPRFARKIDPLLEELGFGRVDASSLQEASGLLSVMPISAVMLDVSADDSLGTEPLSLLPLQPSHRVVVFYADEQEGLIPDSESDRIGYFPMQIAGTALRDFLAHSRRYAVREAKDDGLGTMLGDCEQMREVYTLIAKVAPTDASVLICGESGTGKELVAGALHRRSGRRGKKFVAVNCGAIAENLIESELFGHEKGAFTGAQKAHAGVFEQADGGTLFLDEITEMPLEMQVRLLRVLETSMVRRLGSECDVKVNVRVIAATNRDPQEAVAQGRMREDLLFRLAVFPISLPPLRKRGDDVVIIARHFLSQHNKREQTKKKLSSLAERRLVRYGWPGNVRELRNIIHRAFIIEGDRLDLDCMAELLEGEEPLSCDAAVNREPAEADASRAHEDGNGDTDPVGVAVAAPSEQDPAEDSGAVTVPIGTSIDEAEKRLILRTLEELDGDKPEAARVLGISLKTLYNRLNSYSEDDD